MGAAQRKTTSADKDRGDPRCVYRSPGGGGALYVAQQQTYRARRPAVQRGAAWAGVKSSGINCTAPFSQH